MAYAYVGTVFAASEACRKPSVMNRIIDAIAESRMRAAQREINARRFLIDETRQVLGEASTPATLPFVR